MRQRQERKYLVFRIWNARGTFPIKAVHVPQNVSLNDAMDWLPPTVVGRPVVAYGYSASEAIEWARHYVPGF